MSRGAKHTNAEIDAALRFLAAGHTSPAGEAFMAARPQRRKRAVASGTSATPKVRLEKAIQGDIMRALRVEPRVMSCVRYNSGRFGNKNQYSMNSASGHSDLHGELIGGRGYYIEVKRPGHDATPKQQAFLDAKRTAGCVVGVAHSVEEALEIVRAPFR